MIGLGRDVRAWVQGFNGGAEGDGADERGPQVDGRGCECNREAGGQGLPESLMLKSGVDDEVIKSGENVLLTFTKIRNETGRGNDIFNQATKATLDLSVAMGKDMQSSGDPGGKGVERSDQGNGGALPAPVFSSPRSRRTRSRR